MHWVILASNRDIERLAWLWWTTGVQLCRVRGPVLLLHYSPLICQTQVWGHTPWKQTQISPLQNAGRDSTVWNQSTIKLTWTKLFYCLSRKIGDNMQGTIQLYFISSNLALLFTVSFQFTIYGVHWKLMLEPWYKSFIIWTVLVNKIHCLEQHSDYLDPTY